MEHIKSFGFVPKFFEKIETFCCCKKEVGIHQKVLVLFQNFWNKQKRSTLGSGTHQNVLVSFRFLASISERLCFRFYQCPDPDPPSRIRIRILLLQKSEYATLSRPQQHSHSREKVLVNSLLQANLKHLKASIDTLTASIDILRDLFKPLTASKTSQGLYRHSHGLY